jgi:segregation and condensation protein B
MTEIDIENVIEAALLAAGRPLTPVELRELFDEFDRPELEAIDAGVARLVARYEGRGVELKEVASGWRIQVREAYAAPVSRLWAERPAKYSRALLETLALVAYRQPITRGEIEDIRGVAVNPNIIRTLIERDWVRVIGHREVPGRPELLATTRSFLDYFGLRTLDDLPTLAQLKDVETLGVQLEFADKLPEAAEVQAELVASGDIEVEIEELTEVLEVTVEVTEASVAEDVSESKPEATESAPLEAGL